MEDLLQLPRKLQKLASRSTRVQETPPTAASLRVFGIVELLEKILLDVDLGTLLQAQRTNRLFQRVILSTRSLRQKLWLEPPQVANPTQPVIINPMIEAHSKTVGIAQILSPQYGLANVVLRTTFQHRSQLAVLHPLGNWRDMVLADGLDDLVTMTIWHLLVPGTRHTEQLVGAVYNIFNVRLGDCIDALLSMRAREKGLEFQDCLADLRRRRESPGGELRS